MSNGNDLSLSLSFSLSRVGESVLRVFFTFRTCNIIREGLDIQLSVGVCSPITRSRSCRRWNVIEPPGSMQKGGPTKKIVQADASVIGTVINLVRGQ